MTTGPNVGTHVVWGIDPAATTGYGVLVDGQLKYSGEWSLQMKHEPDGHRFRRLWRAMNELALRCMPTAIAYERGGGSAFNTVRIHGGYHAIIELWALEHGIEPRVYSPTTVKKRFGGHGHADKDAMMDAFERRFGHWPRGDNAADAAAIAVVLWEELAG